MPSGRIRSMAGSDGRMDGGGGRGGGGGIAAVAGADIREPLRSLYQNGPNDPGFQEYNGKSFPVASKTFQSFQRPFTFGSSRSARSSRSASPDAEEDGAHRSGGGGGVGREAGTEQRVRMSSNLRSSSHTAAAPGAEEHQHRPPSRPPSESSEIQTIDDSVSSPMSMSEGSQSYCFSDSQLITDAEDNENLMQLKLEAMTWAAMAKDFTISSLEKRLRKALQIAKAEQSKNHELQSALDRSRQELAKAREDVAKLEEAEERLVRERGESEVDATRFAAERARLHAEQVRQHRSQLLMLEHRIRLMLGEKAAIGQKQQQLSLDSSSALYMDSFGGWQGSDVEILEQELEKAQEREGALAGKFSEAEQEIEELKHELNDAYADIRVSEVLRKTQSRRLKVLEKERRYLLRKGALRTVKLAPRTQRRVEPSTPGGPGWNVFSVLEFEEA